MFNRNFSNVTASCFRCNRYSNWQFFFHPSAANWPHGVTSIFQRCCERIASGATRSIAGVFTLFFLFALSVFPTAAGAQQLTPKQVQLLESLDQKEIDHALAVAEKAIQWRERLLTANDPKNRIEIAVAIVEEAKSLQEQFPKLAAPIDYGRKIAPIIQQAEQTWRQAEYIAEEFEGFNETDFREEAKRRAMEKASEELKKVFVEIVIPELEAIRAPAIYVKNFAEGELKQWITTPISLGDDDSLTARILPPPSGQPLFAPTTEYGAEINYMDDLKVTATGIRIEFQPDQSPRINIENMRVDSNLKDMVLNNITSLGKEFSGTIDLPIKVTLNGKPDFRPGMDGRRGGISFNIEIGLFGGETVKATGENLILYPGNHVDWKGASLEVAVRTESPTPIGTTPFAMWRIIGSLNPQTKEMMVRTQISTMVSPPEIVGLDVGLKTQIPVKSLKLDGHMVIGSHKFMQTEGIIDFEKGEIAGTFKSSDEGSPLAQLAFAEGSFSLKRERFLAEGRVDLFGKSFANMYCELDFVEGSGELYATSGFELFGADFSSTLAAQIDPGFSRVRIEAIQSLTVASIAPYGKIGVIVTVTADSNEPEAVRVVAEAFGLGLKAEFRVPTLAGCTVDLLRRELQKQATASYHQLLRSLADGERDVRKFGAKLDQKTRNYVDDKLGITVDWGNEDLNRLGGDLTREFRNAGGALTDARVQIGGALTDSRETIQGGGRRLDEGVRNILSGKGGIKF